MRQKFTGYQKDEESGLDFAEARMYENRHGRFTAIDPLLASGKSANPQSFNRYVYVMNNPLIYTDPEGLQAGKWYERKDGTGDFIYHYYWNPPLGKDYQEITRRNRAGELISDPTNRTHVQRFNPKGPYPDSHGVDRVAAWLTYSDYDFKGSDVITSDWYEDTFIEHPADGYVQGSKFVGEELILSLWPIGRAGAVGKGAVEATTKAETETFFRTMTKESAEALMSTGKMPAGTETFVDTEQVVAEKFAGVTMKIETRAGTTQQLMQMGVRNEAASHPFKSMPRVGKGWIERNAFFKLENGKLNIGLGRGRALDTFNCNIITCSQVSK